jgi:Concanavalin A-like lectin/glucanases superfamily
MKWIIGCLLAINLFLAVSTTSFAQNQPAKVWERKIGGSEFDIIRDVLETKDGDFSNYAFVGSTRSYGKGGSDVWVGVTDQTGNLIWDKYFGGKDDDEGYSIKKTNDGSYIIAGSTKSKSAGGLDAYVLKIDSKGSILWERAFGGTSNDEALAVNQTRDGGYILTGYTKSNTAGEKDLWVIKLNSQGDREWDKTFGGPYDDEGRDIIESRNGEYIVTGYTLAPGGHGKDLWILRLDRSGNKINESVLRSETAKGGRPLQDIGFSVKEATDGSYVVAGTTDSTPNNPDYWLINANSSNKIWERKFGGNKPDEAYSVDVTEDGGFILAGRSQSFSDDFNVWVVRTDPEGRELWNLTFGGSGYETANAVKATEDGRYILAGLVGGTGQGGDGWLIKFRGPRPIPELIDYLTANETLVTGNFSAGILNATQLTSGRHPRRLLYFDGVEDYESVRNNIKGDFSILFWVLTNQTAHDYTEAAAHWWAGNGLVDAKNCGNNNDFGVALLGKKASFGIGNTDVTIKSVSAINDEKWHHIAATRSKKTGVIKLYVDGVLEAMGQASQNSLVSPKWIAIGNNPCDVENDKRWFMGYIYDLEIFHELLGSQDVEDVIVEGKYNMPNPSLN